MGKQINKGIGLVKESGFHSSNKT